jgi:hypothetical protein
MIAVFMNPPELGGGPEGGSMEFLSGAEEISGESSFVSTGVMSFHPS